MDMPAMRTHKHYWLSTIPQGRLLTSIRPNGGLRSKIIETYYCWLRWRFNRFFLGPKGIIVLTELGQVKELINRQNDLEGIYEIVCHPSINTSDLGQTSMLEERVKEYEALANSEVVSLLAKSKDAKLLITFKDMQ